jgi:hypothetical protein
LLFDAERPEVQQRFRQGLRVEVVCFAPKYEVGNKSDARQNVLAQYAIFVGKQVNPADRKARRQHDHEGRENPSHPPRIEIGEAKSFGDQIFHDDRGDEIAGNDEKDVDADKPADRPLRPCMEKHHR